MKWRGAANWPQDPTSLKVLIHPLLWMNFTFQICADFSGCLIGSCRNLSVYHIYYFHFFGVLSRMYFRFYSFSAPCLSFENSDKKENANMVYEYLKCNLHLTNYTWSHNSQCDFASGKKWEYVFYIKCIAFKNFNTNKLYLNINLFPKGLYQAH